MDKIKIEEILRNNIIKHSEGRIEIDFEKDLQSIGMNSIYYVKLIIVIEQEFGFEFDDDFMIMDKFQSLNEIVDYVVEKLKNNKNSELIN